MVRLYLLYRRLDGGYLIYLFNKVVSPISEARRRLVFTYEVVSPISEADIYLCGEVVSSISEARWRLSYLPV